MDEIKDFINQGQAAKNLAAFRNWLESIALWLEATFPNCGYSAEWLALDAGPPEGDRTGNSQLCKDRLEDAVEERIRWLNKLERVTRPPSTFPDELVLPDSSDILLAGIRLFKVVTVAQADETLTMWIESVQAWLLETHEEVESLANWNTMGNSPFRLSGGVIDTSNAWHSYWEIVGKRYRWLADLISTSGTIENQYRRLSEPDVSSCQAKIGFDGPGYELISLLKEALQKEGGHTKYHLFADDESIYEYAAFKFLVRGKEMSIRQFKKSVENQKYI